MNILCFRIQIVILVPTVVAPVRSQSTRDSTGATLVNVPIVHFLIHCNFLIRSCEKLEERFPLQSPNLVLSVIKVSHLYKVESEY